MLLQGETLFYIQVRVGSFPPTARAREISNRIEVLAKDGSIDISQLRISSNETTQTVDIRLKDEVIVTLSSDDAAAENSTQLALAYDYRNVIVEAVEAYRHAHQPQQIALGAIYSLILSLVTLVMLLGMYRLVWVTDRKVRTLEGTRIQDLRLFGNTLLTADRVADLIIETVRIARFVLVFALIGLYISLLLSFFPWTKPVSKGILQYFLVAVNALWNRFVGYLPNLFFLVLIIVITRYVLRIIRFFFAEVRRGRIVLPGFYQEWARPTYNIIRFAVLAFAATIAFPYLPGSDTAAFRGVSVFLGILFSLGSSGAVANFVSGIILTYSRAFIIGDRVQISDTVGDVIEKTLLVTRINTPKNVTVTIPNAMVLGSHIINYSGSKRDPSTPPLVLHTTITLGYDLPWQQVHKALITAAQKTALILPEPPPFVLQTSLDDFYVSYELNAYTETPAQIPKIYSDLHQNIQDCCNAAGIEILSPHYQAMRDGNVLAVPEVYWPKGYAPPGFRIVPLASPEQDTAK
ncbi:mechanosensitive ion channel family protein [Nodosilinea sp. LEGE 07088]|uniref:mechanosensitive ion channel family protein n=1 Tax=Nodosilinea sp. LEGE 07088 TaxID=2777968 RepID=UPI00187E2DD1|nr:mechanosensitive ion channel family protein [Nodosilinea sp. LEGE 07088]MBE9139795.1 mechanosensitive ion channel family protein [Nodosilinea sp. LEGE 07088]